MGQGSKQMGGSMMMIPSARAGVAGEAMAKAEAQRKRVNRATMRFMDALLEGRKGRNVCRLSWTNRDRALG